MSLFILNKFKKNITLDTIYVKDAVIHFFVMVFCGIINKANDGEGCIFPTTQDQRRIMRKSLINETYIIKK